MAGVLVPTTVLVVVGMNEASKVLTKKPPTMKPVIAGFLVGIGLYAIDGINDRLATLFCILLIIGSLLENGATVFKALGG